MHPTRRKTDGKKIRPVFQIEIQTHIFKMSYTQPSLPSQASPTWPSPAQPPAAGSLAHPSLRSQVSPAPLSRLVSSARLAKPALPRPAQHIYPGPLPSPVQPSLPNPETLTDEALWQTSLPLPSESHVCKDAGILLHNTCNLMYMA